MSRLAHAPFVLLLHLKLLFPLYLHLALSLLMYHLLHCVIATERRTVTNGRMLRTITQPKRVIVTNAFSRFFRHSVRKWTR